MSLRERLLVVLVTIAVVLSLANAELGVILYTGFAVMRPDLVAYAEGSRYSAILGLATLIGSVLRIGQLPRLFLSPFTLLFLFFQIPVFLSVVYSPAPQFCWNYYIPFLQSSVLALLIPVLVVSDRTMKLLVMGIAGGLGFHGLKYGLASLVLFGGTRIIVGPGGFMSDNNTFAGALAMAIPLCWFSASMTDNRWLKLMFWSMTLFSMATLIQTHSRGGIIGLAVVILYIAYRSKRGLRTLVLFCLLAAPVVYLIRDTLLDRLATLRGDPDESSLQGRRRLFFTALKAVPDHLLLGTGFGGEVFARMSAVTLEDGKLDVHVVHNNYLEMQLGSGIFASLAFLAMLFGSIWWLGRVYKRWRTLRPDLAAICLALQGALIGFAVVSMFLSRTYYDLIYILIMAVAAWQTISFTMLRELEVESLESEPAASAAPPTLIAGKDEPVFPGKSLYPLSAHEQRGCDRGEVRS